MKWLRLYTEVIDDLKLVDLSDKEFRHFIYLLCVAGENDKKGLIPFCVEKIAWRLRISKEGLEPTIEKLKGLGILSSNGQGVQFVNWGDRQFTSDDNARYVRAHRERKKDKNESLHETLPESLHERNQNRTEQNRTDNTSPCPHRQIIELYHSTLPELPEVRVWSKNRERKLRARWKSDPKYQDLKWWKRFFESVKASPFLIGDSSNGWKADLEWLITENNFIKVIEGKYRK